MNKPTPAEAQAFSDKSHVRGAWDTESGRNENGFPYKLAGHLLSRKRAGVAWVSSKIGHGDMVCDLGCGKGAYARWFLLHKNAHVVAVDWSFNALRSIKSPAFGKVSRVCADLSSLPLKTAVVDAAWSVDTLGHLLDTNKALDEWRRILKDESNLFLHSECSDYSERWPDREIRKKAGYDPIAHMDGHFGLLKSEKIYAELKTRFRVYSFQSPAGLAGWLIGYPEKYFIAFKKAHMPLLAGICKILSLIKKMPFIGIILRAINTLSNSMELLLGICGGGSCFARLQKNDENRYEFDH